MGYSSSPNWSARVLKITPNPHRRCPIAGRFVGAVTNQVSLRVGGLVIGNLVTPICGWVFCSLGWEGVQEDQGVQGCQVCECFVLSMLIL
jgi:hypothetical protein